MRSNVCTRSSSDGSKRRPCCRRLTLRQCCSGRCSPLDRSTCGKLTVGRRLQQSPSISQLTSLPDQVVSKCRRSRHTKFQHKSRRHHYLTAATLFTSLIALVVLKLRQKSILDLWLGFEYVATVSKHADVILLLSSPFCVCSYTIIFISTSL